MPNSWLSAKGKLYQRTAPAVAQTIFIVLLRGKEQPYHYANLNQFCGQITWCKVVSFASVIRVVKTLITATKETRCKDILRFVDHLPVGSFFTGRLVGGVPRRSSNCYLFLKDINCAFRFPVQTRDLVLSPWIVLFCIKNWEISQTSIMKLYWGWELVAWERGRVTFRMNRRDDKKYLCVLKLENWWFALTKVDLSSPAFIIFYIMYPGSCICRGFRFRDTLLKIVPA